MAGPPKKSRKPSESSSDSSNSEDHYFTQEIQADFEGRNPEAHDFHGIKQLLKQLFLKAHIDLSQMSSLLIEQTGVGSVLKQSFNDDDDSDDEMADVSDVYGITSVINVSSHKQNACIQEFISLMSELSKKHATQEVQEKINNMFSSSDKIGLLINERFINIPPKISDPLLTSLNDELQRIKNKDNSYDFDYFIMVCKTFKPKENKEASGYYTNPEEEMFAKESDIRFDFDVSAEADTAVGGKWTEGDVEMVPYREVLIFKGPKLPGIVQKVKQLLAQ